MLKKFLVVGPILIIGALAWRGNLTVFQRQSQSAQRHFKVGEDQYHRGEIESAVVNMEAAVREDPTLMEARDALGTLYQLTGHRDKELKLYREWVRIDPNSVRAPSKAPKPMPDPQ